MFFASPGKWPIRDQAGLASAQDTAHTRAAQMGNTVDVNENEYAVASFDEKLAAVRKLESVVAPAAQEDLEEEN